MRILASFVMIALFIGSKLPCSITWASVGMPVSVSKQRWPVWITMWKREK